MFLGTRNWTWAHTPFTEHAKNVLKLAVEEARGLGHDRVESEHLLLALIREREGLAGEILEKRGITLDATRRHFEGWLRRKREADGDRAASPGLALWLHGAIEHAADRARPLHERFSERTRWLLGDARSHAWSFYSMEFVAAEHVLLALALDQGPAGAVLKERGITDRNVGDAISKAYPERKELRDYVPKLPFTESAKMLLDLADEEAEGLGQIAIVPEHVLLAVTRDAQGPAGMLLVKLGQDLASLRASLLERFEKTASA